MIRIEIKSLSFISSCQSSLINKKKKEKCNSLIMKMLMKMNELEESTYYKISNNSIKSEYDIRNYFEFFITNE